MQTRHPAGRARVLRAWWRACVQGLGFSAPARAVRMARIARFARRVVGMTAAALCAAAAGCAPAVPALHVVSRAPALSAPLVAQAGAHVTVTFSAPAFDVACAPACVRWSPLPSAERPAAHVAPVPMEVSWDDTRTTWRLTMPSAHGSGHVVLSKDIRDAAGKPMAAPVRWPAEVHAEEPDAPDVWARAVPDIAGGLPRDVKWWAVRLAPELTPVSASLDPDVRTRQVPLVLSVVSDTHIVGFGAEAHALLATEDVVWFAVKAEDAAGVVHAFRWRVPVTAPRPVHSLPPVVRESRDGLTVTFAADQDVRWQTPDGPYVGRTWTRTRGPLVPGERLSWEVRAESVRGGELRASVVREGARWPDVTLTEVLANPEGPSERRAEGIEWRVGPGVDPALDLVVRVDGTPCPAVKAASPGRHWLRAGTAGEASASVPGAHYTGEAALCGGLGNTAPLVVGLYDTRDRLLDEVVAPEARADGLSWHAGDAACFGPPTPGDGPLCTAP